MGPMVRSGGTPVIERIGSRGTGGAVWAASGLALPGVRRLEWHESSRPDGTFLRLPLPDLVVILNLGATGSFRLAPDARWEPQPAASVRGLFTFPSEGLDPENGEIAYASLVIAPWAAPLYLGAPAADFASRIIDASLAGSNWKPLLDSVAGAATPGERLLRVAAALAPVTPPASVDALRADRRLCRWLRDGLPIHRIASESGISVRRLHQRAVERLGLAPLQYAQLARFGRSLESLREDRDHPGGGSRWCDGFADQAHATRQFRRYAQTTPRRYQAWQRDSRSYSIVPV